MLARSGVLPESGICVASAVPPLCSELAWLSLPNQPVGSTQSEMLEQAPSTDANRKGAAMRATRRVLVEEMCDMVPPIETDPVSSPKVTIYREGVRLPSQTVETLVGMACLPPGSGAEYQARA